MVKIKKLLSTILFMFLAASAWGYSVSEKLALEKDYADRLERVLVNVVGKGKVFVFVSLELDSLQKQEQKETYVSTGEPEQATDAGRRWLFEENRDTQYYLPGYPAGQARASQFPTNVQKIVEQTLNVPGTVIKRADVTIMIDPGVSEDAVKPVGRIAGGLLGLSKARGDTISIKRIPFPPPQSLAEQFKTPELLLETGKYVLIFILLMAFIAVFLYLSKDFIRNIAVIGQALRPKLDIAVNQRSEGTAEGVSAAAPAAAGPARSVSGAVIAQAAQARRSSVVVGRAARRFEFVNEDNIKRLGVIMKNEPFENISIAVSYLKPKDVSYVLASLEPAKRSAVANRLVNPGETSFEEVEKVEKTIKNKMEYMVGGSEFMLGVLDIADDATREMILADVSEKNPRIADQLRNELFLFTDIEKLSDTEIRKLVDSTDNETLSVAMKGAPEVVVGRIMANISAGAQANLKQMMDLMGTQPPNKVTEARNSMVSIVRKLINEGAIAPKTQA
jgi:flagellar motor switch protein FliG